MTRRALCLCVLWLAGGPMVWRPVNGAQPAGPPFVLVSGKGYEGVIIPAESLFHRIGLVSVKAHPTAIPWTPAAGDIAALEAQLRRYVASRLKRQYFGFRMPDGPRRIAVHAFPASNQAWKSNLVHMFDGGCSNSWLDFDLDARQFVFGVCGGEDVNGRSSPLRAW